MARARLRQLTAAQVRRLFSPGTWAEAHHWIPWATLRNTDLDNGVLLCNHHHRVHDDRCTTDRLPNGDVRFTRRR